MSSRIWELSFILFFLSLHRVTHFRNHCHKCHPVTSKRLLPNQNSKTYGSKVSHLRSKSQGLTLRNPLAYRYQNKENL